MTGLNKFEQKSHESDPACSKNMYGAAATYAIFLSVAIPVQCASREVKGLDSRLTRSGLQGYYVLHVVELERVENVTV